MIEDCSKKSKKALVGVVLLFVVILIANFREYVNITLGLMFIFFFGIYAGKVIVSYVYCLGKNTQKLNNK